MSLHDQLHALAGLVKAMAPDAPGDGMQQATGIQEALMVAQVAGLKVPCNCLVVERLAKAAVESNDTDAWKRCLSRNDDGGRDHTQPLAAVSETAARAAIERAVFTSMSTVFHSKGNGKIHHALHGCCACP